MNMKYIKCLYAFVFILSLGLTSCGGGEEDPIINPETPTLPNNEIKPVNNKYTQRIEVPRLKGNENIFIQHSTLVGNDSVMTYCLEYDTLKYHSRWVAFRFDSTTGPKNVNRSGNEFYKDPYVSFTLNIGTSGFGNSYVDVNGKNISNAEQMDRGHLCASNDRVYSSDANIQTFYMTNMSPQTSSFNQGYWITFENYIQNKVRKNNSEFNSSFCDTLYVVKGGTIAEGQTLGYVKRNINQAKVVIPAYYYMALLKVKDNKYEGLAFLMEHDGKGYSNNNQAPASVLKERMVTIDKLEEFTGIDFFHNLPDDIESSVEATCDPSVWGL